MKTKNWVRSLVAMAALVTSLSTQASTSAGVNPVKSNFEQEISHFISGANFPASFKKGTVIVRFMLDEQQHIHDVKVYSEDKLLNEVIIKNLTGKTVKSFMPVSYQEHDQDYYLLKLRIVLN